MKKHRVRIAKFGKNILLENDDDFDEIIYFKDEQSASDYYYSVNSKNYFTDRCELIDGKWECKAFAFCSRFEKERKD